MVIWSSQSVLNFLSSKPLFISLSRFIFSTRNSYISWCERYYIISCFIVCTVDFYVDMTQCSRTSDWFAKNCILPDVCSMLTMSGLIFAKWKSAIFGLISIIWAITMNAVVFVIFSWKQWTQVYTMIYRCWFENCKPIFGLLLSQHGIIFILSMLRHVS